MVKRGIQVGLLLFGFFFGAGNLIFPPALGFQAGPAFFTAIAGFVLAAVGLPVVALIVGTFNPGGYRAEMNRKLTPGVSLAILVLIYLIIGPFMAAPRTAATAFSVGVAPLAGEGTLPLAIYTTVYFAIAWWMSITPTKLLSRIGKVLTPLFAIMIVMLFIGCLSLLSGTQLAVPAAGYASSAFGKGFVEGYNTVDTPVAFAFCLVAIGALKQFSFASKKEYSATIWAAGLCVAILMAFIYLGLGLLGNHFPIAASVLSDANIHPGAYVLTQASELLFGTAGVWFLAVMVTLTCFTTSVGLNVSVAEFFSQEFPILNYKQWVTLSYVICLIVANLGLNEIIKVALPALLFIYPVVMTVLLLTVVNKFLRLSKTGMRLATGVAAIIAVVDILRQFFAVAWAASLIQVLPLGTSGLGWLVPVCICLIAAAVLPDKIAGTVEEAEEV